MQWFALRHTRSLWARIALAMMVMAFAAPTVSRALHAWQAQTTPWSVVCQADGGNTSSDAPSGLGTEHCPMCLLASQHWAPPPGDAPAARLDGPGQAMPVLFLRAPRPLFAWSAGQPRAPPRA